MFEFQNNIRAHTETLASKRTVISGNDVLAAISCVELDSFLDEMKLCLEEVKQQAEKRRIKASATKKARTPAKAAQAATEESEAPPAE
jgi:hypothetical protein